MFKVGFRGGALLILNLLRPSIRGCRTAPASGTNVGGLPRVGSRLGIKMILKICRGTERDDLFGPGSVRASS